MDPDSSLVALLVAGVGRRAAARIAARVGALSGWWGGREALRGALDDPALEAALLDPTLPRVAEDAVQAAAKVGFRVVPGVELEPLLGPLGLPIALFVAGRLPEPAEPRLAVVGARRASAYGLSAAERLARALAAEGVWIISGLARGIDAAAHRGALAVQGPTLAVLGAGPDRPYPPEHAKLQREIAAAGAVMTEHLPGTPPLAAHFPRRNRLLVGLAEAVLVVEAKLASGTLTSVRWAADLGREVLVLPGPIDSPNSEGPLALLREGATPVGSAEHVLMALGRSMLSSTQAAPGQRRAVPNSGLAGQILALLTAGPRGLDDLVRLSGAPPGQVLTTLIGLEDAGHLRRDSAQRFEISAG